MTLPELFDALNASGLRIRPKDGQRLEVTGDVARLTTEMKVALRQFKDELLPLFRPRQPRNGVSNGRESVAIGSETFSYFIWTEEQLTGTIAFDTETALIQDHEIPRLALASASDGNHHCLIHPDQLSLFITQHQDLHLVCHNAAFDFWVVEQHLRRSNQQEAQSIWWEIADGGRLHDTMFLDMLLELAKDDAYPRPRDLAAVAKQYGNLTVDKTDPFRLRYAEIIGKDWATVDRGFFQYAIKDPIVTHRAFARMQESARELQVPFKNDIVCGFVERFGLLTESLQVRAAIALEAISRNGLKLDQQQVKTTQARLHSEVDRCVAALRRMPCCDGLFKTDRDGNIRLTAKGRVPCMNKKVLQAILLDLVDQSTEEIDIPRTAKTKSPSTSVKFWSDHRQLGPFIDHWVTMAETAKLCQFFGKLQDDEVHPNYTVLVRTGRTSCASPNIQQLPRKGGFREMVVPSPGHYLLAIDYSFIELRTLAAVCEQRYGHSKLSDVIREGSGPHAHTAAMFCEMGPLEFTKLKLTSPERYGLMRQRAKAVNFGIPGGLGAKSLVAYARSTYGVDMTTEEAEEFRQRLISDIYPELSQYLTEDTATILAANLRAPVEQCRQCFDSPAILSAVRNIVRGQKHKADGAPYNQRWYNRMWNTLLAINKNPDLKQPLAKRQAGESLCRKMFWSSVTTPTGRIRGRVSFSRARNTPFQGLAADGAKLALFALTKASYRCVAFVHDEVLVEIPVDADHKTEAERIDRIMRESMETVTGSVPVACEYALSTRWYKQAEAVFESGRLIPWEPSE